MIICSCQSINDKSIHAAIEWMRAADDKVIITPGKIYRALGKTPQCGGCMKLFIATMRTNTKFGVPVELQGLRSDKKRRTRHEG
ncbi:(2Fe-2S)-binding protein [Falsihalocynthiibacter sp. S25ZX9]|uniref:(2Fe-2S)-binding protein n=1 Tax=Falsihalocynthiibacter sp. S25ZX9 TaxID=3240870 RepID=UPI0009ED2A3F|nr:(2Fe-2S)-binding protein [Falsihalocynthiibacter arcticus]